MMTKYTECASYALKKAYDAAKKLSASSIGTEHLLIGLASGKGTAARILDNNGLVTDRLLAIVETATRVEGTVAVKDKGNYTPRALKVLDRAAAEAQKFKSKEIGTEHIIIAMIKEYDCIAVRILNTLGINVQKVFIDTLLSMGAELSEARNEYLAIKGKGGNKNKSATPMLDQYSRDLTAYALEGRLDPVVGRNQEIQSVIQILSRRTKNNPCLIGEPGVGKTAIAEELARRIVRGDVPENLQDTRLLTLDLSAMVAGSKYRGEFEERIKRAIAEVKASGKIMLFIDEIHTIIGAGGAEGAIDASNILKPSLARGEIQLIGATTIDEYRKYIEKDAALERRFQPVTVEEPTEAESIAILKGLRSRFEEHHGVVIEDEALVAAVKLSERYVNDRFLPDKAIDAMDEAAARLRVGLLTSNQEVRKLEEECKELEEQKEAALKNEEYELASDIKNKQDKLKQKIARLNKKRRKKDNEQEQVTVTEEHIADIISAWTKIPVKRLQQTETEKLINLESILKKRVVGQDEAVTAVAKAVRRGRVGLKDPNRPIGSFLFLGPTGVGKTELSKTLAEAVFGRENNLIRVDMSEYMEKHSVSKMIGSPPGYVGYEEGGQLSERVRRNPYSVLLFDEIEKAHPDVFNILLQVLEDGHITDAQGRKVSFKDTIIIMTSNAGAGRIMSPKHLGFSTTTDAEVDYKKMRAGVMEEVKRLFKPEFINRIDEIIVFRALLKEDIKEIVRIMFDNFAKRAKEQMQLELVGTDRLFDHIAEKGFDKDYGARPVRRAIQTEIEDALADRILAGKVKQGKTVTIDWQEEKVTFEEKDM